MEKMNESGKIKWENFKKNLLFVFEILAIPISVMIFYISSCEANRDRKLEAYRKLGESYTDIMKICMDERCLDCYDIPDSTCTQELNNDQKHKQKVIYNIIINHFEQAYKTLKDDPDLWEGWEIYIQQYLIRAEFRKLWYPMAIMWSKEFQTFMYDQIRLLVEAKKINTPTPEDLEFLKH